MFDLRRLVRMGRSERAGRTLPGEPVQLVAITQNPDDAETLRQIASDCGWRISIVDSSSAAIASLNNQPTPLLISDRDISGENCPKFLAKISAFPHAFSSLPASPLIH